MKLAVLKKMVEQLTEMYADFSKAKMPSMAQGVYDTTCAEMKAQLDALSWAEEFCQTHPEATLEIKSPTGFEFHNTLS
ncbi:MAG: hypothetical protein KGJ13_05335, partial [Patescibacteria group bacterium]|nr:hypothetical protein [Patescibacteria group bacterium]